MEWPSKTITHGGILHPAKAKYSPETHQMLRVLMEEAKLTTQQRRKIDYHLRNGEPLPLPTSHSSCEVRPRSKVPAILIRPGSSKRRTRDTIVKSGAYEREAFVPRVPRVDREKEKNRLQNKMAFGTNIEPKLQKRKTKTNKPEVKEINRFDQIVTEIKEREEWLKKMEEIGEGEQHRQVIRQQIEARVREMRKLELAGLNKQ